MLPDKEAMATIAVHDIKGAAKFYEGTLGLKPQKNGDEASVRSYKAGNASLLVYESQFAGTNKATAVTWNVGKDIESVVKTLKGKGVSFEHYNDMPGMKLQGDIHVADKMKAAWFKDPDGNIIALTGE